MNRQQLIEWLIDDVTPRIRKSGNAPAELLRFANEKNLSPALLEAMGQLFNTAKTLCYLDKSANAERGGDFPLVDVPALVDDYLSVPGQSKSATAFRAWSAGAGRRDTKLSGMPDTCGIKSSFPADLFSSPAVVEEEADWQPVDNFAETRGMIGKSAAARIKKSQIGKINQDIFDANQDCVEVLAKWAKNFRQDPDLRFEALESTAIKRYGEQSKYALDKFAGYLAASNIKVARATDGGCDRLLDDRNGFLADVGVLMSKTAKIAQWSIEIAATEADKTKLEDEVFGGGGSFNRFFKLATEVESEPYTAKAPSMSSNDKPRRSGSDRPSKLTVAGGDDKKKKELSIPTGVVEMESTRPEFTKGLDAKSISGSPYGTIPDAVFNSSLLKPFKDMYWSKANDLVGKGYNHEQAHVDTTARDAKSQALLQNLLLTDDVLSEADPEQVVSVYNTLRRASPELANDVNVMRVALRSAVQHQGVDPFTLKNFSDTELSRMEVEREQKKVDDKEYAIGGSSSGKKPVGSKSEDRD